jgi:hypothetical protein
MQDFGNGQAITFFSDGQCQKELYQSVGEATQCFTDSIAAFGASRSTLTT